MAQSLYGEREEFIWDFNEASYLPIQFVIIVTGKALLEGSTRQERLCPDNLLSGVLFLSFFFSGERKTRRAPPKQKGKKDRLIVG